MSGTAVIAGLAIVVIAAVALICWGAVGLFFDRAPALGRPDADGSSVDRVAELQAKNLAAKREFNER